MWCCTFVSISTGMQKISFGSHLIGKKAKTRRCVVRWLPVLTCREKTEYAISKIKVASGPKQGHVTSVKALSIFRFKKWKTSERRIYGGMIMCVYVWKNEFMIRSTPLKLYTQKVQTNWPSLADPKLLKFYCRMRGLVVLVTDNRLLSISW